MEILFYCVHNGHGFSNIFQNLHVPMFEDFFINANQCRYELMCGLHSYRKLNDKSTKEKRVGSGRPPNRRFYNRLSYFTYVTVSTS